MSLRDLLPHQRDLAKDMSEEQLQQSVQELLDTLHYSWFHLNDRANQYLAYRRRFDLMSQGKGWFDLCAMRNGVVMFIELKTQSGSTSPEQKVWAVQAQQVIDRLVPSAPIPLPVQYYLWRPSHWITGEIEWILKTDGRSGAS